jgi:hypothetical protein
MLGDIKAMLVNTFLKLWLFSNKFPVSKRRNTISVVKEHNNMGGSKRISFFFQNIMKFIDPAKE